MMTANLLISCCDGSGSLLVSAGVDCESGAGWLFLATWAALLVGLDGWLLGGLIFDGPPAMSFRPALFVPEFTSLFTPSSFWQRPVSACCCN